MKTPKCAYCKEPFERIRQLQSTCSPKCAIELAEAKRKKREAKAARIAKNEFYAADKGKLLTVAQSLFNRYIRLRDKDKSCISCGCKVISGDASHFYSVGSSPAVRFDVRNVHLACKKCNRFLAGNLLPYQWNLIKKLGVGRFEVLSAKRHAQKTYTVEYLTRGIKILKRKLKKLS